MSRTVFIYSPLSEIELAKKVEAHQEEFDVLLGDSFSDDEMEKHEAQLESIASISVQPILEELTFNDLEPNPDEEDRQRAFFSTCKSCICLENVPYLESNPFQVTYLIDLLWMLDEVLIDRGGFEELVFKKTFLDELKQLSTMEALLPKVAPIISPKSADPMEALLKDVYREYDRLQVTGSSITVPDKVAGLFILLPERLPANDLLRRSGFIPKDFGDRLESLKFYLMKL